MQCCRTVRCDFSLINLIKLFQNLRDGPIMIWEGGGGLGRELTMSFFPGQLADEIFFLANLLVNLFFLRQLACHFFPRWGGQNFFLFRFCTRPYQNHGFYLNCIEHPSHDNSKHRVPNPRIF